MKNKEIQEKRIRDYFLQAAKDILKSEGIKCLSVRNIADRAGYSYATLYHYFKDVNDLVFLCVSDFQEECKTYVTAIIQDKPEGIERIKAGAMAYMTFFTDYPGIFDLFYLTKVGDFGNKQSIINLIGSSLDEVCAPEWQYCKGHQQIPDEKTDRIRQEITYLTIGQLLLYINRRIPDTYSTFVNQAQKQLDNLFYD